MLPAVTIALTEEPGLQPAPPLSLQLPGLDCIESVAVGQSSWTETTVSVGPQVETTRGPLWHAVN